jgi:hypothetical protein
MEEPGRCFRLDMIEGDAVNVEAGKGALGVSSAMASGLGQIRSSVIT